MRALSRLGLSGRLETLSITPRTQAAGQRRRTRHFFTDLEMLHHRRVMLVVVLPTRKQCTTIPTPCTTLVHKVVCPVDENSTKNTPAQQGYEEVVYQACEGERS